MAPTTGTSASSERGAAHWQHRDRSRQGALPRREGRAPTSTLELADAHRSGDREALEHHRARVRCNGEALAGGREQPGARATAEHRRPVSPEPAREGRPHRQSDFDGTVVPSDTENVRGVAGTCKGRTCRSCIPSSPRHCPGRRRTICAASSRTRSASLGVSRHRAARWARAISAGDVKHRLVERRARMMTAELSPTPSIQRISGG